MNDNKLTTKWFKVWFEKMIDIIDPAYISEYYQTDSEREQFFSEIGKAFCNILLNYVYDFNGDNLKGKLFRLHDRTAIRFQRALVVSVRTSFVEYQRSVENGKRGAAKRWNGKNPNSTDQEKTIPKTKHQKETKKENEDDDGPIDWDSVPAPWEKKEVDKEQKDNSISQEDGIAILDALGVDSFYRDDESEIIQDNNGNRYYWKDVLRHSKELGSEYDPKMDVIQD